MVIFIHITVSWRLSYCNVLYMELSLKIIRGKMQQPISFLWPPAGSILLPFCNFTIGCHFVCVGGSPFQVTGILPGPFHELSNLILGLPLLVMSPCSDFTQHNNAIYLALPFPTHTLQCDRPLLFQMLFQ